MKRELFKLLLCAVMIAFISCSTGPDFERDNPYDRNLESDSLGLFQFPPPQPYTYIFTGSGLKLNLFGSNPRLGEFIILRRNGSLDYKNIDTINVISRGDPVFSEYYLDPEIIHPEDIGYPLGYEIIYDPREYSRYEEYSGSKYIDIKFGSIQNVKEIEESNQLIVSWQDSVFLNNGFQIFRKNNGQISDYMDLAAPDTSFSIPLSDEFLSSEYLITPYKFLNGERTYLDTTYYYPTSPPPTNFNFEIINGKKFKLSWLDNSSMETGFKIINNITDEVIDLPANRESIVIEKELSANKIMSFTIFAVLNDRLSTSTRIDTTIPDFPYPKITGIKHIDKKSFEIYFEDRVEFDRQIQFSLEVDDPSSNFVVGNTKGVIKLYTFGEYETLSVTITADLSYGKYGSRYIPISLRPTLETLAEFELGSESDPKTIDIRTIGSSLIFTSGNNIYKTDLTTLNTQPSQIASLPANINLLRLSNDNSKTFAGTSEETYHLVDVVNGSIENLNNLPDKIYDISFIEDDTKIVASSNEGLIVYSLITNQSSQLNSLDTTSELEFSGDASQTRLLALDRANYELHYFNTTSGFEYFNTATIDKGAIDGYKSNITNVSHLNSNNNVLGYEIGGGLEFRIDDPRCNSGEFICYYGYYDRYYFPESVSNWDRNAYFLILDSEYRIASTENYLRIVSKTNLDNIHAIKRQSANVSMLKVNYENKIAVEFHEDTKTLVFYDLSKKWSFTNYGEYKEWVWPSN